MVTINDTGREVLLILCKDFSRMYTITYLAREVNMSRVGMWKVIKNLKEEKLITLIPLGKGKTGVSVVRLNWDNILLKKALELYLIEESEQQERWKFNFSELEEITNFSIIYGSILKSAEKTNDIDIINIAKRKDFIKIQNTLDKAQKTQAKKIHTISFTSEEFKQELIKENKAFIDALKKGVILFGQENFIKFMEQIQSKKWQ